MKREVYYKKKKIEKFNEIFDKYGMNEFKSPYRSTIPLLLFFESIKLNNFGLIDNSNKLTIKYSFEYQTKAEKGKGKASCTDLMIECQDICIAVEAKRTEPPYSTVKKWLDDSENKKLVLEGWLGMIERYTSILICVDEIHELPYQLIHRVASACSMKKVKTHVIYLGFDLNERKKDYYLKSINSFMKLLNNKINIQLICFKIFKSLRQESLELSWDGNTRDLSNEVINGMKNDTLMKFTQL
jgi:hypothetical protein